MKIFLTGATGFVGSHLVAALASADHEIRCLVRPSSNRQALAPFANRLRFIEGSLDPSSAEALAEGLEDVSHVFHIAGATKKSKVSRQRLFEVNEGGTRGLITACLEHAPKLERFVFVSTMAAFGPSTPDREAREDATPHPISDYGASKKAAEDVVLAQRERLAVTVLRPSGIIGPRDPTALSLFKMVKRGLRPTGRRRVNFIHVRDVVSACIKAAEHEAAAGEVFHLGGENISISELGRCLASILDSRTIPLWIPSALFYALAALGTLTAPLGGRSIMDFDKAREYTASWALSTAKLEGLLGWQPSLDFAAAARETADWYRGEGWL